MLQKMKALLRENSLCVLATSLDDKPHCSLMAYITDDRAVKLYMVTLNTSRKYRNIMRNPRVSLLVDSRIDDKSGAGSIKALTVSGTCSVVRDKPDKDSILARMEQSVPSIREIMIHPDAEVISIQVESLLLLEGPAQAHFIEVGEKG